MNHALIKRLLIIAGGVLLPVSVWAQTGTDVRIVPLAPPYVGKPFGTEIFFPAQETKEAHLLTPGRKHLEISLSTQRLRAYDETGQQVLEAPVSTGKPGLDEKGRERVETLPGIHRIVEVKPSKRWSKDPKVKMLDWIGLFPGVEKGIHGLEPIGEFADYERFLGRRASHGCIRVSRKISHWLVTWLGEDWKTYPVIVDIYKQSLPPQTKSPFLLMLILQEGAYLVPPVSLDPAPSVQRTDPAVGTVMKPGDFVLYRKEADGWHLVSSSKETRRA